MMRSSEWVNQRTVQLLEHIVIVTSAAHVVHCFVFELIMKLVFQKDFESIDPRIVVMKY